MRVYYWTVAIGALAGLGAQSLDPLAADPQHYKLEIENPSVRVIREHMTAGEKMPMHQHPLPGSVIVFLTERFNRLISADGAAQDLRNKAGELMWSAASTHRSENLSGGAFEALQIEPRRPRASVTPAPVEEMDAVKIDPQHYHVEVDNEFVRVLRVNIGPHEKLRLHKHPDTNAVLVHLTDQNLRLTLDDGTIRNSVYPAKHVRWVERSTSAHQDENLSDMPLRFIRIELKLSR